MSALVPGGAPSADTPIEAAPLLEAVEIRKTFRGRGSGGEVTALNGVSITVGAGETLGIVGESGSGKSTLARILIALETPTAGEVRFHGERVSGRRERELRGFRRSVQMIFQDPMSSLDPRMKVHDLLAEPLRALGVEVDEGECVRELLGKVELPATAANRRPHEFSGGQRQRIAIARALGPSPEVLVADEPVSALDVSVRSQILNLLADLVATANLSLVFISHDMAVVRHLCHRVAVLYRGDLVESGATEALFQNAAHDYTRELIAAAPRIRVRERRSA
jgi:peptide/nickel transport system ATP-binding protein